MEANHQAEVCAFRAKPVKDQRQREGRHNAGQKRTRIGRAGALLHFVHPGFVVRVIAHLAYPGSCEQQGRVPQESHHHCGYRGYQDCQPIQAMHVHE